VDHLGIRTQTEMVQMNDRTGEDSYRSDMVKVIIMVYLSELVMVMRARSTCQPP